MSKPVFIVNPEATYSDCIDRLDHILRGLDHAAMSASLALETQGNVPVLPNGMLMASQVAEQGKLLLEHITEISKHYHGYAVTIADAQAHASTVAKNKRGAA